MPSTPWHRVWSLAIITMMIGLVTNEFLLLRARHIPSVVDNADLFCTVYSRIDGLGNQDVLLLGASRMQTNFDLGTFRLRWPDREILQLAQSGSGSAYPVFESIVNMTNFAGVIIIDETDETLISPESPQAATVRYCQREFSLNRQLNRSVAIWMQATFRFLNPQSNSLRLWSHLAKGELPEPMYTTTNAQREQFVDYNRAVPARLAALYHSRMEGIKTASSQTTLSASDWIKQTEHWAAVINQFRERGGRIIFVRMPVDETRWVYEGMMYPPANYWDQFMEMYQVQNVHFAVESTLRQFVLADTSHLDMRDRALFTANLLEIVNPMLQDNRNHND